MQVNHEGIIGIEHFLTYKNENNPQYYLNKGFQITVIAFFAWSVT